MAGLVPATHVLNAVQAQGVDGRDIRAFTPVFDGLLPGHDVESVDHYEGWYYLLQPFPASSNPSNKRPALAPARVSSRCGWSCSTL